MNKYEKYLNPLRIGLIILAILLVVFILAKDLALGGSLVVKTDFKKFTSFVSLLVPEKRTEIKKEGVNIVAEPVYFDLALPRDFSQTILQFTYQNENSSFIEVGANVGDTGWQLKPLENKILDNLNWAHLEEGGLILFQREPKYKSIHDFIFNLPAIKEIATYNYDLNYDYKIADYKPADKFTQLNQAIDSSYKFLTYIKNEPLHFEFVLDGNGNEINEESTVLNIYNSQNENLKSFYPEDNKIIADLPDLAEGVYKLELTVPEMTITKTIKTKQQYLSFINQLNLLAPADLTTESHNLYFLTFDNAGLQKIKLGKTELAIDNLGVKFEQNLEPGLKNLSIPKGNLQVTGKGLFAFEPSQYFNPLTTKVIKNTDFTKEKINYVLADYQLPTSKTGLKIKTVTFNLFDKSIKNGKLRFVISVPDLNSKSGVLIKNLTIKLIRPAIWQEGLTKNIINYLKYIKDELK